MANLVPIKMLFSVLTVRSHRLFRAFFIPYVSRRYVSYVNYNILVSVSANRLLRI